MPGLNEDKERGWLDLVPVVCTVLPVKVHSGYPTETTKSTYNKRNFTNTLGSRQEK